MTNNQWHSLNIDSDIIAFGTQRIPTRNVASISIVEDPLNEERTKSHINRNDWIGFVVLVGLIFFAGGVYDIYNHGFSATIWLVVAGALVPVICIVYFEDKSDAPKKQYQVNLLTNGGSITALTGLYFDFAEKVLTALQNAISGNDHRNIFVDASKQEITVGSIDMSQKTYRADNSPSAVVGGNTGSTISTNVTIQGVQDVEKLMARVGEIAGDDRAELLKLLIEIRAHIADGSVPKAQAQAAYTSFLGRIGKYFSTASDIVSLVSAIGKFL